MKNLDVWSVYESRMNASGSNRRNHALKQERRYISNKIIDSLSCHEVTINGIKQTVSILNKTEDFALKKICALPGDTLEHGGIVDFANSKWLIIDIDANDEVYSSGIMKRCNYILRWLNNNGEIIEKWCIIEDGTKYLIGEKQSDMMSIGDARIALTIQKDADTNELKRGMRFLIDDYDTNNVLAYQITKPNKLYNVYNGKGVFRFILNEVNLTDDDNIDLRIADYFNWKSLKEYAGNAHVDKQQDLQEIVDNAFDTSDDNEDNGKKVWL